MVIPYEQMVTLTAETNRANDAKRYAAEQAKASFNVQREAERSKAKQNARLNIEGEIEERRILEERITMYDPEALQGRDYYINVLELQARAKLEAERQAQEAMEDPQGHQVIALDILWPRAESTRSQHQNSIQCNLLPHRYAPLPCQHTTITTLGTRNAGKSQPPNGKPI